MSQASEELLQILRATLSDRADIRRDAESAFLTNWVPRPAELFPQLVAVLLGSYSPQEQSLAAIFFRRWINRESVTENSKKKLRKMNFYMYMFCSALFFLFLATVAWNELSSEVQVACKAALLESFNRSNDRTVRNRISDAISQVANIVSQYEEWRELMEFIVVSMSNSSQSDDSLIALLRIITATPDLFSNQDSSALMTILSVINGVVSGRPGVAVDAVQALSSLTIFFYPDEKRRTVFTSVVTQIVPSVAQMLSGSINEKEDEMAQVLNCAADMVFECPRLFSGKKQEKNNILSEYVAMASALIRRLSEDEYAGEDKVASAALEFICAAVEGNPSVFRRDRALLETSAVLLLQVTGMESGTDDWLTTDPTDEDDNISMSILGQQSLDRFALALGGAIAGPILFNHIGTLLSNPEGTWRNKYSGLMAVASTAEGCAQEFLEDHLEGLLAIIWPCFNGAHHPRVQYAACHALGQLCTDFPGRIQEEFARDALTALLTLLQNSQVARVQCHASAALVNFSEDCEPETIAPFLDGILSTLATILASPACPGYLKEQLIATIGAYSGAAQSRFANFFDRLLPLLVAGLDSSQSRKVQCRAVEALSLVLLAVKGSDSIQGSFNSCLPGFLNHMSRLEEGLRTCPADDPMREFLASAWLRLAQLMGREFVPWLQVILPNLLHVAGSKIVFTEMPENDDEEGESELIPATRVNGRNVGINTSSLTEKASALESLGSLMTAVGPGVFPEAEGVFTIACDLVNFEWSGDVRSAAVECSTAALECLGFPEVAVQSLVSAILKGLTEMYETDFACSSLDALSTLFTTSAKKPQQPLLSILASVLSKLNEILPSLLEFTCGNIREIQESLAHQKDAEEEEDVEEEGEGFLDTADEEEVLYAWGRLQAAMFECFPKALENHKWAISFCATQIRAISVKKSGAKRSSKKQPTAAVTELLDNEALHHVSLGVLCDGIEWMKMDGAVAFGQDLIDACLTALSVSDSVVSPLVRQVGAHLSGQMALFGGVVFRDFCIQAAAPLLTKLISRREARAPSQLSLTDNAVSALIRIQTAFPGSLAPDNSTFIGQFILSGLPVISDDAEVSHVAAFLIQNYNPQAVWAPTVLSALVAVKTTPSASAHLKSQVSEALQPFLRDQLAKSPAKDFILGSLPNEQISRL